MSRFSALLALVLWASTASAQVVISQVYGGGGNSGATLTHDYVELFNRGTSAVNLSGLSIQYTSATGTGLFGANATLITELPNVILQPGKYFLVQQASNAAVGAALPTPDFTDATPIAMAAGAGKVVLVNGTTPLGCNGGSTVCDAAATARILDLVGYGNANFFEGAGAAPTISAILAAFRASGGCADSNNNSLDFATATPAPRNSSTATVQCSVSGPTISTASPLPAGTVGVAYSQQLAATGGSGNFTNWIVSAGTLPGDLTLSTTGLLSGTPNAPTTATFTVQVTDSLNATGTKQFSLTINAPASCSPTATISQVQGSGATSPLVGQAATIQGIVTATVSNGFYVQTPDSAIDSNPNTSEGIFVFTSSAPPAAAARGNNVCVTGTVIEFTPSAEPFGLSLTEITQPTVVSISTGNPLPAPVVLPTVDLNGALDQLERFEGMRVSVPSLTVVAPTDGNVSEANATSSSNGVFFGVISGTARPFREPGIEQNEPRNPATIPSWNGNPERLHVDSDRQPGATQLNVATGQTVTGLVGVLDYFQRTYSLAPDPGSNPVVSGAAPAAVPVPVPNPGELTVASFNLERFFDNVNDPALGEPVLTDTAFNNRLNKASLAIRNVLRTPDVLGIVEAENLSTLQALATKINSDAVAASQPNPNYVAYLVEGLDIGGIDVGFLVKSSRVSVISVVQEGATTTFVNPAGQTEVLNDRPPLVLQAAVSGFPFTVIVNHLRSLIDIDDPTAGPRVRAKRKAQAEFLANLVQARQTANPAERIILVGDFNAFELNDGYVDSIGTIKGVPAPASQVTTDSPDLVNPDLTVLAESLLPASERYSFSFRGNAQMIDHVITNPPATAIATRIAFARSNVDFPETFRNDSTRPERLSDHDAPVAYFQLPLPANFVPGAAVTARVNGTQTNWRDYTVRLTNNAGLNATNCSVTGISMVRNLGTGPNPTLVSTLPIAYGDWSANGGNTSRTITALVDPTTLRFNMTLTGACQMAGQAVPFTTTVTTFR